MDKWAIGLIYTSLTDNIIGVTLWKHTLFMASNEKCPKVVEEGDSSLHCILTVAQM